MATARVFKSGNSQVVRLPKEFRVKSTELEIFQRGDEIVLREPARGLARAFELLASLPDDFLSEGRGDMCQNVVKSCDYRALFAAISSAP
ncbi:MAG: AbrB/MazE/SpoVT family DNA-binding domain-containing protein [Acidobacteriaceae bacterium]|nr:AbrB/MazE/SpoVT family DNA-binding domain-containing protein [Acidobacteriaceae bacterium]